MIPIPVQIQLLQLFNIIGILQPKLPREVILVILQWYLQLKLPRVLVFGRRAAKCSVLKGTVWQTLTLPGLSIRDKWPSTDVAVLTNDSILVGTFRDQIHRAGYTRCWIGRKTSEPIDDLTHQADAWLVNVGQKTYGLVYEPSGEFAAYELYIARIREGVDQYRWIRRHARRGARYDVAPVGMGDGRILICGGSIGVGTETDTCIIYDPNVYYLPALDLSLYRDFHQPSHPSQHSEWSETAPMSTPRNKCAAVLLPNWHILVSGGQRWGYSAPGRPDLFTLNTCEIYDPFSNSWYAAAPMLEARYNHALVVIGRNEVMAVSGLTTEILNLDTNVWRAGPPLNDDCPEPGRLTAIVLEMDRADLDKWA